MGEEGVGDMTAREELEGLVATPEGFIRAFLRLREITRSEGISSYPDFCQRFGLERPSMGYNGHGSMNFHPLFKGPNRSLVVLAALNECSAPPHFHPGGECTFTAAGILRENTERRFAQSDVNGQLGTGLVWEAGSFHQPWSEVWWGGLYYQPQGFVPLNKMTKAQLQTVISLRGLATSDVASNWDSLSDTDARVAFSAALGLNGPSKRS